MSWRVADSLDALLAEINTAAPTRSKASDGSIGDAAHASRQSDHNPWVTDSNGEGVVRARDFTHDPADGLDCHALAAHLATMLRNSKHPALASGAYIIWDGEILSRDRVSEGWRPYTGSNPHRAHLHLSVTTAASGYDSTRPWGWPTEETDMDEIREQLDRIERKVDRLVDAERARARRDAKRTQHNTDLLEEIAEGA